MKRPLQHLLTIAIVLGSNIAAAQDSPVPPRRDDRPDRAPADAGRRDDERRPEANRQPRPGDPFQPGDREIPGERRDRPMPDDRRQYGPPQPPARPQPFLGVATGPLDPSLSAQLGITPGLGLIVEDIIPDGPAAKAGVQALDVIKQINDQLVSSPSHLSALVRHFGKDTEVTLLVLRKGQEQKIAIKIGERMMRETTPLKPELFGSPGMPGMGRQMFERRGEGPRRNDEDPNLQPRERRDPNDPAGPRPPGGLLPEIGPGGPPNAQSFDNRVRTTWNTASANVHLKDASGEIEIRSENGRRTLTAKNPKGEPVFAGPIDTDEQRKAVPAEFRKMLEQVEARARTDRPAGAGNFGPTPVEPGRPTPRPNQPEVQ